MQSFTLRTFFGSIILASLAACGGSGDAVDMNAAAAPAQFAAAAPAPSQPLPVASACNDPSCMSGGDGLADQYRMASIERAAKVEEAGEPAYPNVPAHAMTLAEARTPEALGTAAQVRAN